MYKISEIFPAFQGEGSEAGRKTIFIRFYGCPHKCSFCDSRYAWESGEYGSYTLDEVVRAIQALPNIKHITFTGGEPMFYDLTSIMLALKTDGYKFSIETQGAFYDMTTFTLLDNIVLSPKSPIAGAKATNLDNLHKTLDNFGHKSIIKIPIFTNTCLNFAKKLHHDYPNVPLYLGVGNASLDDESAPEQFKQDFNLDGYLSYYRTLMDLVLADAELVDVFVLPQLHVIAYGNERGK
ncbi:MAG: 7-carboxy-7-deazaguanine synthase QueE [Lactobacillales bacterium]|jgi:7-carboxy-7-deazaguanine synthase|nr:7-carboxy-7-deazaguanine synthase QueE [Lactobacillales bacterium]